MKRSTSRQEIHPVEWAALGIAGVAIIGGCLMFGAGPLFWVDEVFTALPAGDPSFGHMLAGLKDEINAQPPLHFAMLWAWARIFGVGELSLRLPSAVFAFAAIVSLWSALRSFTDRWVAVACSISLTLLCQEFGEHIYEARCYSLYFAAFSLAFALYVRGDNQRGFDWRVFASHALLVSVHYVGGLFSALLVISALATWKLGGDVGFRRHALSAAAGWLAVIPSLPYYMVQRNLAGEDNWLKRPILVTLLKDYIVHIDGLVPLVVLLLFAWLAIMSFTKSEGPDMCETRPAPRQIVVLGAMALLFNPAIWLLAQWGPIIFLPRYLHPIIVVWIAIIAWSIDQAMNWSRQRRWEGFDLWVPPAGILKAFLLAMSVLASLSLLMVCRRTDFVQNRRLHMRRNLARVAEHKGVPVVTLGIQEFGCLAYYLRPESRVSMLIDESIPHQRKYPIVARWARALERHYFPKSTVTKIETIAEGHDRYLVIADAENIGAVAALADRPGWVRRRVRGDVWMWERSR